MKTADTVIASKKLRRSIFNAWIILLTALAATGWSWRMLHKHYLQDTRAGFDLRINYATDSIRNGFSAYEQMLRGAAGLVATVDNLTQDQWQRYADELPFGKSLPGAQAIGFSPVIEAEQQDAHLQVMRKKIADYSIWPTADLPYSIPVSYVAPTNIENLSMRGFNFAADPLRHTMMQAIAKSGATLIIGKAQSMQPFDNNASTKSLMILPVYKESLVTSTKENRNGTLLGFVYLSFILRDFMQETLGNQLSGIDLEIYENPKPRAEDLLFATGHTAYHLGTTDQTLFTSNQTISLSLTPWTFVYATPKDFDQIVGVDVSWAVLAGGTVISLLAFGTALSSLRWRNR